MNDKVIIDFTSKITPVKPINDQMTLCKCYILAVGENRNKSNISKSAVDKALPTIYNIPIVGHLYVDDDNETRMGGHDRILEKDTDGKYKFKVLTVPFGVVPQQDDIHFEEVEEKNGDKKEYLVGDIILWTGRYPELLNAKYSDETYFNQSMEILPTETRKEKGITYIDEFQFSALCMLGKSDDKSKNVEPCFESARIEPYEFSAEWTKLFGEFKDELAKCYQLHNDTEGGKEELELEEHLNTNVPEENPATEEVSFESTEEPQDDKTTTQEDVEAVFENVPTDETSVVEVVENAEPAQEEAIFQEEVTNEPTDAPVVEEEMNVQDEEPIKFTSSSEMFTKQLTLGELMRGIDAEVHKLSIWDTEQYACYRLVDADFEHAYVEYCVCNGEEERRGFEKMPYSVDESGNITLHTEKAVEVRQVWLTAEEEELIKAKDEEFEALKTYKAERVEQDRREAFAAVLNKFIDLADIEEFQKLSSEALSFSNTQELEDRCYAIRGKYMVKQKTKPISSTRIPVGFGNNQLGETDALNQFYATYLVKAKNK